MIDMECILRLTEFDSEVSGHSVRTGNYAKILAGFCPTLLKRYPEMTQEKIGEAMYCAGCMHDIGKIMYSPYLLRKPDKLTVTETEVMHSHPKRAVEILRDNQQIKLRSNDFRQIVENGCLYHHEQYNGTGYPFGLSSELIPPEACIVAVCDVLDALTAIRSYKEAWDFDQAVEYIVSQGEIQYSSATIDSFWKAKDSLAASWQHLF